MSKSKLPMKIVSLIMVLLLAVTMIAIVSAKSDDKNYPDPNQLEATAAQQADESSVNQDKDVDPDGPEIYIVMLENPPLALYEGDIKGFAPTSTSVTGERKLDANSPDSVAYVDFLKAEQDLAIDSAEKAIDRSLEIAYQYQVVLNGYAAEMTPEEAAIIERQPGVFHVERDMEFELQTDHGPAWIGADTVWDGSASGVATQGEGVIVGVIDTGIDPWNPSFLATGDDGYTHTNPRSQYYGVCDINDPSYDASFECNDKLIGAWGYPTVNGGDPRDANGHGSHTASTSAGNVVYDSTVTTPGKTFTQTEISGVAPHANIIMYAACCTNSALTAAQEQVVIDQVDAVNYSIGASSLTPDPWASASALSWMAVRNAGIFVATSAGNNGPGATTVGSPADLPWMMSVGASSHDRFYLASITLDDGVNAPITLDGTSMTGPLTTPAEVVFSIDYADPGNGISVEDARLCADGIFPAGTFSGEIVICERGSYGRVAKGQTVADGGAGGYVLAQPDEVGGGPGSLSPDPHVIPAVHIDYYKYQGLIAYFTAAPGAVMGTISESLEDVSPAYGNEMASFSSRGPNGGLLADVPIPNITAPGRAIWAAYHQGVGGDTDYTFNVIQGTSMSSPHVAGAGALMIALHPDWTPAQIQSALMTTADPMVTNDDGVNPATPFAMGSGNVDLEMAAKAGLVLDVTTTEFEDSDPRDGGDPKELNLASLGNAGCLGTCSWTRTLSNTQAVSVTWTASATGPITVTVDPPVFEIGPNGTQVITVTADVNGLTVDEWAFGQLDLTPSDMAIPSVHFPVSVQYATGQVPDLVIINTDDISGTHTVEDIITLAADPLNITADGLVMGTLTDMSLDQDPTNGDPYDNVNDGTVEYITVTVPVDGLRLVAEITSSEAPDIDLFVGTGTTPSAATEVCASTSGSWEEYCNIIGADLVAGDWWILVQNWSESANAPDDVTLSSAVVAPGNLGNFAATGPASVAGGAVYEVDLDYDVPGAVPGDRYYGAVTLVDDVTPLATFDVDLRILPTEMLELDGSDVTFDLGIPNSFTVTDDAGNGLVWSVTGADTCVDHDNWTGGSGLAACADDDVFNNGAYDTSLVSNEIDFSSADSCSTVTLDFLANYQYISSDRLDVDISTDDGATWTTELSIAEDTGAFKALPGAAIDVDLVDYLDEDAIHIRFRYYNLSATAWDWYAQVDDVSLTCITYPEMVIDPTSLVEVVPEDLVMTTTLTISNTGTEPLDYNVYEDGGVSILGTNSPNAILWEQTVNGTSGIVSDLITGTGFGTYSAEDFVLNGTTSLELIYTPGFDNGGDISTLATAVSWWIFADDGGAPLGNPAVNAGAGDALWHYTDVPSGTGIDITDNEITLDIVAATGSGVSLSAGRYWLVVAPTVADDATRWNWYQGAGQDNPAMLFDEGNFGGLPWTALGDLGVSFQDLAFRLEGEVTEVLPCDVSNDMSWLSVDPTSGIIDPDNFVDLTVTYDATGLTSGVYTGTLCVDSNDLVSPLVQVPVTMTVEAQTYGVELSGDAAMTGEPGEVVTYTVMVTNTGNVMDDYSIAISDTWGATSPVSVTIDAGAYAMVDVAVMVPVDAADGDSDIAEMTVTSDSDVAATASVDLTTTAFVEEYLIYLPVIMKPAP